MIQAATSAIQTTRRHEVVAKIRELAATDSLAELTDLIHRAYARLGQMGLQHTAVDQSVEVTAQRICGGACYVATLTDVIVGTIVVHPTAGHSVCTYFTRPGVAAAHQLAVEPAHQSLGIGRLLLQSAEQWAAQHGFRELALDAADRATHLVEFYSNLGYAPVGHVTWPGKQFRCTVLRKHLR